MSRAMRTPPSVIPVLLVFSLLTVGCDQSAIAVPDARWRATYSPDARDLGVPREVRREESSFAELANDAPSSAGFYFDESGDAVVVVRDSSHDVAAVRTMQMLIARGHISSGIESKGHSSVKVQRANFTFRQLAEWRDVAFDAVLGERFGVHTLDLDERSNRVLIGIAHNSKKDEVAEILAQQGVPIEALSFVASGGMVYDAAPTTIVDESSDPLAGGLLIRLQHNNNDVVGCTLGFAATRNGVPGLVTVSQESSQCYDQ